MTKPDDASTPARPTNPSLPTRAPHTNLDSAPFWAATGEGRLKLQRCDDCGTVIWWPRAVCPECSSFELTWFDASGEGTVYSHTVVHRSVGRWSDHTPYVVAYVELDEGPRLLTNIVDGDHGGRSAVDEVAIDARVRVVWYPTGEGNALPRFTLL